MRRTNTLKDALAHFTTHDPIMATLLTEWSTSSLRSTLPIPEEPAQYFARLTESIIGQQISTKAAASIRAKLAATLPKITPEAVLETPDSLLRDCGLSPQKLRYIKENAALWHTLPINDFATLPDEVVITELMKLYGVGRWTAEMFCIFTLARRDVFSFGDLGLMQSLYHHYHLKPHYHRKIERTVATWSPYRSAAALALWHARDTSFVMS